MKCYRYIFILLFSLGTISSCDEDYLTEVPKDFLSPENAFVDKAGFEQGLTYLYISIRSDIYSYAHGRIPLWGCNVDVFFSTSTTVPYTHLWFWETFNADNPEVDNLWRKFYNWIYQANVIIDRAEEDQVTWASDAEKNAILGEARFLRAFGYRFLANMWGGVPIVLNETTGTKFDFGRATQEQVYLQCKEDLEFAVQWMHTVDKLPGGRAPRAAAYNLLAEIYICLKDYDKAIEAASKVIDDPNFHLMTERFGKWTNFEFTGWDYRPPLEPWGDVYWDLFREGNMNYLEGNRENIWNIQLEFDAVGGGGNLLMTESHQSAIIRIGKDINGVQNLQKDTLMGRPNTGATATYYTTDSIWRFKGDWDRDIRNSKYNVQREIYFTNPNSEFYGQPITESTISENHQRYWFLLGRAVFKKGVATLHHGTVVEKPPHQKHDGNYIWKDWYIMRLPETYFLRAEAYFLKGDKSKAAADINVVRNRAKATPVTAEDVNLDLILDERVRELYLEEFRLNTLMRTGKLVEYLYRYNPEVGGKTLGAHVNKFPIPHREIEANKEGILEQNPGY